VTVDYGRAWALRRAAFWSTHPKVCARCGSTEAVLLHHATYAWPIGEEPDEALVALCSRCHAELHRLHRRHPNRDLERLTRRFVRWGRLRA
jgi:hypothetical protein